MFYIGQTVNLKQRLNDHNCRFRRSIGTFTVEVLEVLPFSEAAQVEQRYITDLVLAGVQLENHNYNPAKRNEYVGFTVAYRHSTRTLSVKCSRGCEHSVAFDWTDEAAQQAAIATLAAEIETLHPFFARREKGHLTVSERLAQFIRDTRWKYAPGNYKLTSSLTNNHVRKLYRYAKAHGLGYDSALKRILDALPEYDVLDE